ncbi:MAG: 30S ribosomal protein S5 [Proteobacteria bacterium]|nr:30S ribosomal protein S5 [Pseudomonadota bacterium]
MDVKNKDIFEKVIEMKRVVKKITGGNKLTFTTLALVGDKKGKVGIALGKGLNVQQATQKAFSQAKKNMVQVKIVNETIPHEVDAKYKSSKILMKPAKPGTGVVAGGSIRDLVELAGINNISVKLLGSSNKVTNIYCALKALGKLK